MSFNVRCPECISGQLTSTVTVRAVDPQALVSGAFFDVSGNLVQPTFRKTITTLCSNGHTFVNVVQNIPRALVDNLQYFVKEP